jgi:hypothetical protein
LRRRRKEIIFLATPGATCPPERAEAEKGLLGANLGSAMKRMEGRKEGRKEKREWVPRKSRSWCRFHAAAAMKIYF